MDHDNGPVDLMPDYDARETLEMQILVLGLSRTGTTSLCKALRILGYNCYHMTEAIMRTRDRHLEIWSHAVKAKYTSGADPKASPHAFTGSDFRKLLGQYDVLSDIPCILFVPELLEAYPKAKVVLTVHPSGVEGWLRSVSNSFFRISRWAIWRPLVAYDPTFSRPYMFIVRRTIELWSGKPWPCHFESASRSLSDYYAQHNTLVRDLARTQGRDLLEFNPNQGWKPLCAFLGKQVPDLPYPSANKGDSIVVRHKLGVGLRLLQVFGMWALGMAIGMVGVGVLLWCYYFRLRTTR